jgi:hypothetical protein
MAPKQKFQHAKISIYGATRRECKKLCDAVLMGFSGDLGSSKKGAEPTGLEPATSAVTGQVNPSHIAKILEQTGVGDDYGKIVYSKRAEV